MNTETVNTVMPWAGGLMIIFGLTGLFVWTARTYSQRRSYVQKTFGLTHVFGAILVVGTVIFLVWTLYFISPEMLSRGRP